MIAACFALRSSVLGDEQVPGDGHPVLVLEGDLLHGHLIADVEVVRAVRHVLSRCE
jgi:hypothetical protein